MNKKIEFLKKYRVFAKLSNMKLSKIVYLMNKTVNFIRGQYVYKEGQNVEGMWLVANGEFEHIRSVKDKKQDDSKSKA